MKFAHVVRMLIVTVSLGVMTLGTSVSAAAIPDGHKIQDGGRPFGLACTNVRAGFVGRCEFHATAAGTYPIRQSNSAVITPESARTDLFFGNEPTEGAFLIGGIRAGGVTICILSNNGAFKSCDTIEVFP